MAHRETCLRVFGRNCRKDLGKRTSELQRLQESRTREEEVVMNQPRPCLALAEAKRRKAGSVPLPRSLPQTHPTAPARGEAGAHSTRHTDQRCRGCTCQHHRPSLCNGVGNGWGGATRNVPTVDPAARLREAAAAPHRPTRQPRVRAAPCPPRASTWRRAKAAAQTSPHQRGTSG